MWVLVTLSILLSLQCFVILKKFLKDLEIIKIIKVNSLKERHFYSELKIWAISAQDALVIAEIILGEFPFLNFFFLFVFLLSKITSPHLFSFIYLIFLLPFFLLVSQTNSKVILKAIPNPQNISFFPHSQIVTTGS